jgi:hypothetical protein
MLSRCLLVITLICGAGLARAAGQEAPQQLQTTTVETNEASEPNEKSNLPKPRISFEKLVHDFGVMDIGQKGECEFRFKNIGSGPLNINEIKSTCGCTAPSLAKTQYLPGEEGIIKIDYSGQNSPGSVEKTLYVYTNDPENQTVGLAIKATVITPIEVSAPQLRLLMWKENAAAQDITLKSKDGNSFAITSLTSPGNAISAEFDPNISASEFVLKLNVDTQKLKEHPTGSIQIGLTHPKQPSVSIPYEAIQKFQAQPARLMLTRLEPGESQTGQVLITNTDGQPFKIDSISSKKGFAEVVSQQPRGESIELTVRITAPPKKNRLPYFGDELEIKTDSGETITLPCSGLYRRPTDGK